MIAELCGLGYVNVAMGHADLDALCEAMAGAMVAFVKDPRLDDLELTPGGVRRALMASAGAVWLARLGSGWRVSTLRH